MKSKTVKAPTSFNIHQSKFEQIQTGTHIQKLHLLILKLLSRWITYIGS